MAADSASNTDALLDELHHVTGRPAADLAAEAVAHLHRTYIGLPPAHPDAPRIDTGPFRKRYSDRWAEIVLRQVDATHFKLDEPFRFIGKHAGGQWIVPASDVSDLASVPSFLTWLVPRYGRHTLAALLHDHLQKVDVDPPITAAEADIVFRDAMGDTGVPLLRRWMMWSAVSAMTRLRGGGIGMVAVGGWLFGYTLLGVAGVPAVVWVIAKRGARPAMVATAVVLASPVILGAVWGRDYRFAVTSGLGAMLIGFSTAADLGTYGVYVGLETGSRLFQRRPNPIRRTKLRSRFRRNRRGWELGAAG